MRLIKCLLAGVLVGGALGVLTGVFVGWALAEMSAYPQSQQRTGVAIHAALLWALLGVAGGLLVGSFTWLTSRPRRP
jgi:hypothetical protein